MPTGLLITVMIASSGDSAERAVGETQEPVVIDFIILPDKAKSDILLTIRREGRQDETYGFLVGSGLNEIEGMRKYFTVMGWSVAVVGKSRLLIAADSKGRVVKAVRVEGVPASVNHRIEGPPRP